MKSEEEKQQDEAVEELATSDDPDLKEIAKLLGESNEAVREVKKKSARLRKAVDR
jgi:hypothetical protein